MPFALPLLFYGAKALSTRHLEPLTVLWITPMRALAADTARALQSSAIELAVPWTVGLRTGDTSPAERARQNRRMPSALITTPESLTLVLTRPDARDVLSHVRLVIVDEWHELLGNKRGTQTQLALARLAHWQPGLQAWGLSATLGNLAFAAEVLLAPVRTPRVSVHGKLPKALIVDTVIPETIERFPWGGHMGMRNRQQHQGRRHQRQGHAPQQLTACELGVLRQQPIDTSFMVSTYSPCSRTWRT